MKNKLTKWFASFFEAKGPPAAALSGIWTLILVIVGLWLCSGVADLAGAEVKNSAFKVLALVSLAALVAGFFIGFLFGIPRVVQGGNGDGSKGGRRSYEQKVNTNLEQISDWLTKILIGVGLVELKFAPEYLWKVANKLSQAFSAEGTVNHTATPAVCAAIAFFAVIGTLFGYLITRLYFAAEFAKADQHDALTRGYATETLDASEVPANQVVTSTAAPELSDSARRILATLVKYQKEHCGSDATKRWTFAISPISPLYPEYIKGLAEVLNHGLVVVSPETNQTMLSTIGMRYLDQQLAPQSEPYAF